MPLDSQQQNSHDEIEHHSMSLGDHLEELRSCVIRGAIGVILALIVTFIYGNEIIIWLQRPMLFTLDYYGLPTTMQAFDTSAGFGPFMQVALVSALVLASPWVLYQAWIFVSAGLYSHEKKVAHILAPFSTIMAIMGIAFTYYIFLPVVLNFFISFSISRYQVPADINQPNAISKWTTKISDIVNNSTGLTKPQEAYVLEPNATEALKIPILKDDPETLEVGTIWISAEKKRIRACLNPEKAVSIGVVNNSTVTSIPNLANYISFATFTMLGVVVAFQLPVILFIFGWTRLIDPKWIGKQRKWCILIIAIIAAILTPTDLFSMFALGLPLYILFETGLLLMHITYRHMQRKADKQAKEDLANYPSSDDADEQQL